MMPHMEDCLLFFLRDVGPWERGSAVLGMSSDGEPQKNRRCQYYNDYKGASIHGGTPSHHPLKEKNRLGFSLEINHPAIKG